MTSDLVKSLDGLTLKEKPFVMEKFKKLLNCCLVPEFCLGDDRPCEESDFSDFREDHEGNIYHLKLILEEFIRRDFFNLTVVYFDENEEETEDKAKKMEVNDEIFTLVLIICGENCDKFHWNTENCVMYCLDILKMMLKINGHKQIPELLVPSHSSKGLFRNILLSLRPKLLAPTWKHYPAAVACYSWVICKIVQPHLSPFLNDVLPTALILVDDYVNENRIKGIMCLEHIIENITITELKYHGHGDVMHKALEPLLRNREADLMNVLLPCFLKLVSKLESNIGEKEDEAKWSRFDDILEIILENMELEHLIALREAYIQQLNSLVKASGIKIIRWSRRLLRVLKEYLEVSGNHNDLKTTRYCMEAMESYLKISRPVVHLYSNVILFMLFKSLYNVISVPDDKVHVEIKEMTIKCIKFVMDQLPEASKEELKNELSEKMSKSSQCHQFFSFLKTII